MRKVTWAAVSAVVLAAGFVFGVTAPAHATAAPQKDPEIENTDSGNYLNNWNGGGTIRFYGDVGTNEDFGAQFLNRCNGGDQVLGAPYYCPFSDRALDTQFAGDVIGQYTYNGGASCLGDPDGSGFAELTGCNRISDGMGGGQGTLFVFTFGCPHSILVNRYWSDVGSQPEGIAGVAGSGDQVQVNGGDSSFLCMFQINEL